MKEILSISQLLSKISKYKKEFEEIKSTIINPKDRKNTKLMLNLYNKNSGITLKGLDSGTATRDIISINDRVISVQMNLLKYISIKDKINNSSTITINRWDDPSETVTMTISQALFEKSHIKDYMINYYKYLKADNEFVRLALAQYMNDIMSNEKIDRYVRAKMSSLNLTSSTMDQANYEAFAKEYRDANMVSILDPLDIENTIDKKISDLEDYYRTIDEKIFNFNTTTFIYIEENDDGTVTCGFVE